MMHRTPSVRGELDRVGRHLPAPIEAAEIANLTPELIADLEDAKELVRKRRAAATIRAYDADLRAFMAYLKDRGQAPSLPTTPLLVAAFVSYESRPTDDRPARAIATIERRLAAIGKAHQLAGADDPT